MTEFNDIERRLDELNERLQRLRPLREKTRNDFAKDPYLRDIVKRNLEVVAQCCIDICGRIISVEDGPQPQDYYEAIRQQCELGVLPPEFAEKLAPLAGFQNMLAHQYLRVDWDEVYSHLQQLDNLDRFTKYVREWLRKQD